MANITITDKTNKKLQEILGEIWDETQNEEVDELLNILERKEQYLFRFKNKKTGDCVYIWSQMDTSAEDEIVELLDDFDDYELDDVVKDIKGNEVVRHMGAL